AFLTRPVRGGSWGGWARAAGRRASIQPTSHGGSRMRHRIMCLAIAASVASAAACSTRADDAATSDSTTAASATASAGGAAVTSLLGTPLAPRPISAEARAGLEERLAAARAAYDSAPSDADSIIWFGRRLAYLERYD